MVDLTDAAPPVSCAVCAALTLDMAAHSAYHAAVANADPIALPDVGDGEG